MDVRLFVLDQISRQSHDWTSVYFSYLPEASFRSYSKQRERDQSERKYLFSFWFINEESKQFLYLYFSVIWPSFFHFVSRTKHFDSNMTSILVHHAWKRLKSGQFLSVKEKFNTESEFQLKFHDFSNLGIWHNFRISVRKHLLLRFSHGNIRSVLNF